LNEAKILTNLSMAGWHLPDSTAPFSEVGMVGCLVTYFMHASMGVHWTMWEWIGWSGRCLYRGSLDSIARNCGKWFSGGMEQVRVSSMCMSCSHCSSCFPPRRILTTWNINT